MDGKNNKIKELTEKIIFLKMTSNSINKKETIQKLQQELDLITNGTKEQSKRYSSI
jgi:hypothetical protein